VEALKKEYREIVLEDKQPDREEIISVVPSFCLEAYLSTEKRSKRSSIQSQL
jgi:hypothetical protein